MCIPPKKDEAIFGVVPQHFSHSFQQNKLQATRAIESPGDVLPGKLFFFLARKMLRTQNTQYMKQSDKELDTEV